MKAQLEAVQKVFWILLGCSVVIAVAAVVPPSNNRQLRDALNELTQFQKGFDQKKLEAFLYDQASKQGRISLEEIAKLVKGEEVPPVTAKPAAAPVDPQARVDLGTLAAANAFSGKGASISIGSPRPQQVVDSLIWRLARRDGEKVKAYTLIDLKLEPGQVGQADVELEGKVFQASMKARRAKKEFAKAKQKHDRADAWFTALRKRRAHWRPQLKAQEKRDEARAEMESRQKTMEHACSEYEKLAQKAGAFSGAPAAGEEEAKGGYAIARVTLQPSGQNEQILLNLPVALELRSVPVPPLTGCEFTQAKAAGVWDAISNKTAAQAIDYVEARFSWHYGTAGRSFLQITPLLLLAVLVLLFVRIGKAAGSYNPFDTGIEISTLPPVGFGPTVFNFIVVVVLTSFACILCIWSLLQIDIIPVVPIFCGLLVLGLGAFCYLRMNELKNLRDALVRGRRASQAPPKG